jgi:hypothetical protein
MSSAKTIFEIESIVFWPALGNVSKFQVIISNALSEPNDSEFKFWLKEIKDVMEIVIEKRNFIIQLFDYYFKKKGSDKY